MKTKIVLLLVCITALVVLNPVDLYAIHSKAGTFAYSFLKIPVGAKAAALGGAYTGLSDDESGMYYNPAGISQISGSAISGSYNNYLAGIQGGFLSYIMPWRENGKIGVAVNYLNYGSTTKTDVSGNAIGDFGGGDLAFSLTVAWMRPGDSEVDYTSEESYYDNNNPYLRWNGLSLGMTAKFIYESLDEYSSDAVAVDIGLLYGLKDHRTRIGIAANNLGFQMKSLSSGHKESTPATLRAGVGHHLKDAPLIISVDAVKPFDNDFHFAAGVNFVRYNPLEVRAGYSTLGQDYKTGSDKDNWAGLSFGIGLKLKKIVFDYAIVPFADIGNSHRVAVSTRW